jgi:hypothetical protein
VAFFRLLESVVGGADGYGIVIVTDYSRLRKNFSKPTPHGDNFITATL